MQRPLTSTPRYFEEAREEEEVGPAVTTSGAVLPSVPVVGPAQFAPDSRSAATLLEMLDKATGESTASAEPGAYVPLMITEVQQELVPVPASVFDDDFFKKPNDELRASAPESRTQWPEVKVPSFAGHAQEEPNKGDDLDIPAFMRRTQ